MDRQRRPKARNNVSIPIVGQLRATLSVDPTNPVAVKSLTRLSRSSLITLALEWLSDANAPFCPPFLYPRYDDQPDPYADDFNPPGDSIPDLRRTYNELLERKGSKREIVERILDGDWRRGLSLCQLALADFRYLDDHPASQRWSAYRVVPLKLRARDFEDEDGTPPKVDKAALLVPRFHASTFLKRLIAHLPPDVKAYPTLLPHASLPLLILRIFVLDTPYNTRRAFASSGDGDSPLVDGARTIFVAFPDASPHVFVSRPTGGSAASASESKSLRSLVVDRIPGALSQPGHRFKLRSTSLVTRNLAEMCERRGNGRGKAAAGGWGIYADEVGQKKRSPLDVVLPSPPLSGEEEEASEKITRGRKRPVESGEEKAAKRRRKVAQARFGDSGKVDDGKGIERLDIVIEDPFPVTRNTPTFNEDEGGSGEDEPVETATPSRRSVAARRSGIELAFEAEREARGDAEDDADGEGWRPRVRMTFHGSHVFAGIRQLVEAGIVNGEKMPAWMTGEEGVSIGVVRHGRIRGHKGSGI